MKVWFIGEGPFAALCLGNLKRRLGDELERVFTGHPTRANRGRETPSPVEVKALELGLVMGVDLFRVGPLSKDEDFLRALDEEKPDAVFVVDFGQMIREPLLSAPRFGCLNIHPSSLPQWRGAAPIQRALMNGDESVGVTVFRLVPEMDAGPVLKWSSWPIGLDATASGLYEKLSALGCAIAAEGLKELEAGTAVLSEQLHPLATVAPKLEREEFEVLWDWSARRVHNTVRALDRSGGAFVTLRSGKRLKLWSAFLAEGAGEPGTVLNVDDRGVVVACALGAVRLKEVQAEGKRRMSAAEWARGCRLKIGTRL
ncbi:MAG: methionyl-tRNA formyltransferase [Synergistaceae bacterium]|nr:methionyl-tRNA formyltransferase [Synergistaceae bacterium]